MAGEAPNGGVGSAAALAHAATAPIKVETIDIPGFGPKKAKSYDPKDFSVKYLKIDFDDPAAVTELEQIETAGLRGEDIVVLSKEKFTFMDKFILIVMFLQRN